MSVLCEISMRQVAEMIIKDALLSLMLNIECFISRKAQVKQCFNYFNEFPTQYECVPCSLSVGSVIDS